MPQDHPATEPEDALAAWRKRIGSQLPVSHVPIGLLSRTFAVGRPPAFALQLVAAQFTDVHNARIEAVAAALEAGGLPAPTLLRTDDGALSVAGPDGRRWRLQRWLAGESHDRLPSPDHAYSAAAVLARFHAILRDSPAAATLEASDFHDTAARMARMAAVLPQADAEIRLTGEAILAAWDDARPLQRDLELRPGHGDAKISNVLFDGATATALVDFDTLALYRLDDDIGDAFRSWCNPLGEDTAEPVLETALFRAAVDGYLSGSPAISPAERASIVPGTLRIALELASRFCLDAFEQNYFAWNENVAPDRRGHNLLRARGQLSLARQLKARFTELQALVGDD